MSRQVFLYVLIARLLGCSSNTETVCCPISFTHSLSGKNIRLLIRTFGECHHCLLQHAIELIKRRERKTGRRIGLSARDLKKTTQQLLSNDPSSPCFQQIPFFVVVLLLHFLIPTTVQSAYYRQPPLGSHLPLLCSPKST